MDWLNKFVRPVIPTIRSQTTSLQLRWQRTLHASSIYEGKKPIVSRRGFHTSFEIDTPYHKWFPWMCEYGFEDGKDHWTILSVGDGFGKAATRINHFIIIPMAEEAVPSTARRYCATSLGSSATALCR
jgi:hypothetical protein